MLRLRRIRHPQHGSGGTARWSALLVPRDRRRGLTVPPTVMALRAQQSWQGSKFTRPLSRFRRLCDLLTYVLSACHVSAPCTGTDSPTGRGGCSRRPQRTTRKSSAGRRTVHKRDSNFRPPTYTDVFHVKHRPNSPGTAHSTGGGETRRDRSPNPPQSPLTRPAENPRWAIGGLRLMKTPTDGTPANRAPTDPGTVRTADQGSGSPPPPSRQSRAVGGGIAHASRPVDAPRSPGSARPTHTTPHRAAPRRTAPGRHDRTPARPSNRRRARSTSVIYTEPTGAVTFGRSSLRVAARKRPHPAIVRADQSVECPSDRHRFHWDCHPLAGPRVTTSRDIILEPRPWGIEGRPTSVARHPHRFNGSGSGVDGPPREKPRPPPSPG